MDTFLYAAEILPICLNNPTQEAEIQAAAKAAAAAQGAATWAGLKHSAAMDTVN